MSHLDRSANVARIAEHLDWISNTRLLRVAVDRRTAAGKTTLAQEIAASLEGRGRTVILATIDGFHQPRARRYRKGRFSPEGYYQDARDLEAVRTLLLDPLAPGGSLLYAMASFDLGADRAHTPTFIKAAPEDVLVVDGTFLQRPELSDCWDYIIFVDVSEDVARDRFTARGAASVRGADATELYKRRYAPAFDLYTAECGPKERADVIWDNTSFDEPVVRFKTR